MKIGTNVCLVGTDGYMPPIGSCGIVTSGIDEDGDYLVFFPDHLCPHPPSVEWFAHQSWLIPLNPLRDEITETAEATP